jgi:small subunit ribosomal protein S18
MAHKKQIKTKKETKKRPVRSVEIDYKNVGLLSTFMGKRNQILPKKYTKLTSAMQRKVTKEIKKARQVGLLKYTDRH